jgi:hypothetical protein
MNDTDALTLYFRQHWTRLDTTLSELLKSVPHLTERTCSRESLRLSLDPPQPLVELPSVAPSVECPARPSEPRRGVLVVAL